MKDTPMYKAYAAIAPRPQVGAAPILATTMLPFLNGQTWKGAGAKPPE